MSVWVVAAMVVLVGCTGGEPDPPQTFASYTSTVSAAATPEATPTPDATGVAPAAPVRPPEMDAVDGAGAAAAARYFLELHLYALATGDLAEWDRVSSDGCDACARIRAEVVRVYSSGGHFDPSELTISRVEAGPQHPTLLGFPVEVDYALRAGAEYDSTGTEVAQGLAETGTLVVDVLRQPGGWVLIELSIEAEA